MNIRSVLLAIVCCSPVFVWGNELPKDTLKRDTLRNYHLQEVIKTAPHINKLSNPQMGMTVMDYRAIKNVPTLFGEADVIKALQLQPGVSAGMEGFAGMYVRGGENDENMFLIDGTPVYQMNHLGGLFSAYNADAINGLAFYKCAFPARYGGRLSSVTDISMKSGDYEKYRGHFTIGLTSANFSFSGPLVKDKTSLFIALRRSWLELVSIPTLAIMNASKKKSGEKTIAGYNFTDFNLKVNQRLGSLGTLSLLGYYGHDHVKMGEHRFSTDKGIDADPYLHKNENRLGWGNLLASLKWHLPLSTLFTYDMKASYTRYQSDFKKNVETSSGEETDKDYEYSRSYTKTRNAIDDVSVDAALAFTPSEKAVIRLGTQYTHHAFSPEEEVRESTSLPSEIMMNGNKLSANEWNCYLEGDLQMFRWLRFNAGLRGSFFRVEGKNGIAAETIDYSHDDVFLAQQSSVDGITTDTGIYGNEGRTFTDDLFNGTRYTLKIVEKAPLFTGGDSSRPRKIILYSLSEAYYHYLTGIFNFDEESVSGDLIDLGFSEPSPHYTNITGGTGIIGAVQSRTAQVDLKSVIK